MNNGINYQPKPVQDFSHQQYHQISFIDLGDVFLAFPPPRPVGLLKVQALNPGTAGNLNNHRVFF